MNQDIERNIHTQEGVTLAKPEKEPQPQKETGGASTIRDFDYDRYAEVERKATNTRAVAGLTLGILSLVFSFIYSVVGVILGIVGLIFSIKGKHEAGRQSMALAGMICSIIGIVVGCLVTILALLLIVDIASESVTPFITF